jgi:hypothetical protein
MTDSSALDAMEQQDTRHRIPSTDDIVAAVAAEMDGLHTRFGHLSYTNREGELIEKLDQKLTFYVGSLERDCDFAMIGVNGAKTRYKIAKRAELRRNNNPDADTIDGREFMRAEEALTASEAEYNQAEDAAEFGIQYFRDLLGYDWSAAVTNPKEEVVRFTTPAIYAAENGLNEKTVERQAAREAKMKKKNRR